MLRLGYCRIILMCWRGEVYWGLRRLINESKMLFSNADALLGGIFFNIHSKIPFFLTPIVTPW